MRAPLPPTDALRLKAALRDLVALAGGGKRAAEITGLDASTISRQCSPELLDRMMAMDHIAVLERDVGRPVVSVLLVEMASGGGPAPATVEPHAALAALAREAGSVTGATLEALSDGVITPTEAAVIDAAAAELIAAVDQIRWKCAAIRGGAGRP